ncbi:MAG: hypothetical protein F6K36_29625 [Symploca sp. SIO3C6]|nr:hypothetical protein [Symploca sp. SIO3C6]
MNLHVLKKMVRLASYTIAFFLISCNQKTGEYSSATTFSSKNTTDSHLLLPTSMVRVKSLQFSSNSDVLLVAGSRRRNDFNSNVLELWDTTEWKIVNSLGAGFKSISWASFYDDGKIVYLDFEGGLSLWEIDNKNRPIALIDGRGRDTSVTMALSASKKLVALGYDSSKLSRELKLFSIERNQTKEINILREGYRWSSLDFTPDGSMLASVSIFEEENKSFLDIINIEDDSIYQSFEIPYKIFDINFVSENILAISGSNGHIEIFKFGDFQNNYFSNLYSFDDLNNSVLSSANGNNNIFAVGSFFSNGIDTVWGRIKILSAISGELRCLVDDIRGASNINTDIALSSDGLTLAATENGQIKIWNLESCHEKCDRSL